MSSSPYQKAVLLLNKHFKAAAESNSLSLIPKAKVANRRPPTLRVQNFAAYNHNKRGFARGHIDKPKSTLYTSELSPCMTSSRGVGNHFRLLSAFSRLLLQSFSFALNFSGCSVTIFDCSGSHFRLLSNFFFRLLSTFSDCSVTFSIAHYLFPGCSAFFRLLYISTS